MAAADETRLSCGEGGCMGETFTIQKRDDGTLILACATCGEPKSQPPDVGGDGDGDS